MQLYISILIAAYIYRVDDDPYLFHDDAAYPYCWTSFLYVCPCLSPRNDVSLYRPQNGKWNVYLCLSLLKMNVFCSLSPCLSRDFDPCLCRAN